MMDIADNNKGKIEEAEHHDKPITLGLAVNKNIGKHCSQWEENKFPIEKDPLKKGFVRITSSVWKNDKIKVETKSVKLK
jgi:hypothetical protein